MTNNGTTTEVATVRVGEKTTTTTQKLTEKLTVIIQSGEHRLDYRQSAFSLLQELRRAENTYSDLVNTVREKLKLLERGVL